MTRIDMIPSPFDRLDPIAQAVRWWTSQMIDVLAPPFRKLIPAETLDQEERIRAAHAAMALPETDAFVARLTLPKGSSAAHASAIRLRLGDLAPADPAQLQISATAIEQADSGAVTYAIAMARRDRLDNLEKAARRKGVRSVRFHAVECRAAELRSGKAERKARRSLAIDAALVAMILAGAVAASVMWTMRIEGETSALAEQERSLRRAVVAAEAARRDADLARDFIDKGVLDRRAGAVLETLAALNNATPANAWWSSIRWSPQDITLAAQSNDPTKAIEAISAGAKNWTVELSGTLNAASGAAAQAFELKLRPREAAPR